MQQIRRFGLKAALALVFWTAIGLLSAAQLYFVWREGTWGYCMRMGMPQWLVWGCLAPLIFAVDRRWFARFTFTRRIAAHIPLGIGVALVALFVTYAVQDVLEAMWAPGLTQFVLRQSLSATTTYALIAGASMATSYADAARLREQEAVRLALHSAQLESSLTQARLRLLQAQLNPHFLFNAFNTISALTENDPKTARRTMDRLATLLRSSLNHAGRQEVTLLEELRFLDDYLGIERLRFQDRLTIDVHADNGVGEALVPSFVLQPLVENAIRHGTGAVRRDGHVRVTARRAATRVVLEVEDDGAGLPDGWRLEDHAGVGLSNVASRLRELYGEDHTFAVLDRSEGGVRVEVSLPFRQAT
jgi:two-component system LytT family sensor kinase